VNRREPTGGSACPNAANQVVRVPRDMRDWVKLRIHRQSRLGVLRSEHTIHPCLHRRANHAVLELHDQQAPPIRIDAAGATPRTGAVLSICLPGCSWPDSPPSRHPCARRHRFSLVIICCVQCIFRSKFFWRATLFTIQGRGLSGYGRWCPRGDITCGPTPHTLCQPQVPDEVNACIRQFVIEHRKGA